MQADTGLLCAMLSRKAKYALKALEYIAEHGSREPIRIADIAAQQHIPQKFLEAILLELRKDGLLRSRLGKNGGYLLNKSPNEIRLGHVIRLLDGPIAMVSCVSIQHYTPCEECEDEVTCGLRQVFGAVREATHEILDQASLADVIARRKRLRQKVSRVKK